MTEVQVVDWPAADLEWVVRAGRERLAGVLSDTEHQVCERVLALSGEAGALWARLVRRKPRVFFVADLDEALELDADAAVHLLCEVGLATTDVDWTERIDAVTVPVLSAWCRTLGLPVKGRRADKVQRLLDAEPAPLRGPWIKPLHRELMRILEQAAFLDKEADSTRLVVERLGLQQWPDYAVTPGPSLFSSHGHRLGWQTLWAQLEAGKLSVDQALQGLSSGQGVAPGRLSLVRRLRHRVLEEVEARKADRADQALLLLDELRRATDAPPTAFALLESRLWESLGDGATALAVLQLAGRETRGASRLAVHRSGRRLARAQRRAWVPDPPLRKPVTRSVKLTQVAADRRRPTWSVGDIQGVVEVAVAAHLDRQGRTALMAEGGLIRTLFALLFAETYFLPIPGALPASHLAGPLDVGTAAFATRRRAAVDAVLGAVDRAEAPERVERACAKWAGVRLAGVSRDLTDPGPWVALVRALGPVGLRAVLDPLLERGWGAAAGLPDLLILDGPDVRLDGAHPSRLGSRAVWVEVKGPGDSLRDGQKIWIDHLLRRELPVEVWSITPRD
ncbi:MAG: VRR-NUC domain-containing protein [Myxococcota bacterium]